MYKQIPSLLGAAALAASCFAFGSTPDFAGEWKFSPAKSTNVGMMSMMKIEARIRQTADLLVVTTVSVFNGAEQSVENRFDLTGKPVENWTPMSSKAQTVSRWQDGRLVTTWTQSGAPAGSQEVRAETRYLSADGKTMTVESAREKASTIIMVYERK